ncbi:cyclic nucleotide-binding protein [Desulfobulbus propionicus DSM 2032]|uniref:Cyclic nucleotide-binding protein n=1 Tax=Desulfobulbus propionicus (strain ATCC 33891 / DSM 2032 / VKM B-1956 / 1pr3) TaxID=577650 RepID=A0A7U4DQB8_DESPD|nr:type IV-A pilus assembly ATPase PilB [Desulfobulbus propionicus]ADW18952.1 cyclic nucleotide-binding protein [Desulfobulbus propionicus DSM 2032]
MKRTVKDQSGAGKLKIGELLSKAGYITATQFEEAKAIQKKTGERLGRILLESGAIERDTIANFLSRMHNYPLVVIDQEAPSREALDLVPYETAKRFMAFPLRLAGNTLQVTMAEPTDSLDVEQLQDVVQKSLNVCVSTAKDIIDAYKKYYQISDEEYHSFFKFEPEGEEDTVTQVDDFGALVSDAAEDFEIESSGADEGAYEQFSASDAPIIKLVNGILVKAVQEGVSDIHIEPFEKTMQVRYRKDGSLFKSMNLPLTIKNAMAARMKILAGLNITERRVPQDGRIKIRLGRNKAVDFRVSTLPLLHGEGIVLRILDKSSLNVDLTKLGFTVDTFAALKRCLQRPQGLLLVTGPTGSGKTVTLYSALNSLNTEDIKILTAEDPVEFNFKGINQVNVNAEVGMTFAAALKAFLRQDPDIIMVGEIRDIETAEIAMKAAMTGHLVFSTLHTNDSPATVSRMVDIGIPSYILASSLTMVLSQRLGRRLCQKCKIPAEYDRHTLLSAGFKESELDDLKLFKAKGCPECNGLGYRGRVGFFELMEVTEAVAEAIQAEVSEEQLRKVAIQEGMYTLREAGLQKAREGVTSLEEVLKRTVAHEDSLPAYLVNPDVEEYEDGDVIIQEGNKDKDFFKLIRGKVAVLRSGKKIAEITEPGEYFGEMAAILEEPRSASIISVGRCTIKRYPGDKLNELIEKYPEVSRHLFRTLVERLQKTDRIVVQLASATKIRPPQVIRQA